MASHKLGTAVIGLLAAALLVAACAGSTSTNGAGASSGVQGATAAPAGTMTTAPATPEPTLNMTEPPNHATAVAVGVHPCSLLSADQVSQFAGSTMPAGKETNNGATVMCNWVNPAAQHSVSLIIGNFQGVSQAQIAYEEARAQQSGMQLTPVSGLGDEATIARSPSGAPIAGAGIYVRKGTVFFAVTYIGASGVPSDSAFESTAKTVLGQL